MENRQAAMWMAPAGAGVARPDGAHLAWITGHQPSPAAYGFGLGCVTSDTTVSGRTVAHTAGTLTNGRRRPGAPPP